MLKQISIMFAVLLLLSGSLFAIEFIKPYKRGGRIVFSINDPAHELHSAYLTGNFNEWNPRSHRLMRVWPTRRFQIEMELTSGVYRYLYILNQRPSRDLANPLAMALTPTRGVSLLYISSNGNIDWNHDKHFVSENEVNWQSVYPVTLSGYYSNRVIHLRFKDFSLNLKPGKVRLIVASRGVTGLVYAGRVDFKGGNQSGRASRLFARFHPEFFTNYLLSSLIPVTAKNAFIDCNDTFYLKKSRFYYDNERFIIPPKSFLGLSLSDDMYGKERLFVLTNGELVDLHPRFRVSFSSQASLKRVKGERVAELTSLYRRWLQALSQGDASLIRKNLSENSLRFAKKSGLFKSHILAGIRLSDRRIEVKTDGRGHFVLSAGLVNHQGRSGESRIVISRVNDRWLITTYSVTF